MDCIKKHFWRVVAIFFILTTIGLSVGWGISSEPCPTDPPSTVSPASMNPKIIVPEILDPSGST